MSDTHINAFHGAVDEAKAEVAEAQGKLEAAEAALKAHPDYEEPEKPEKNVGATKENKADEAREAEGEGEESPAEVRRILVRRRK